MDATTGIDLGTVPLADGVASLTTTELAAGSNAITANYEGDQYFAFSQGSLTQVVSQSVVTSTAITSSASQSVSGESITFTATVSPSGMAAGTPTGLVQFEIDGNDLGSRVRSMPAAWPHPRPRLTR